MKTRSRLNVFISIVAAVCLMLSLVGCGNDPAGPQGGGTNDPPEPQVLTLSHSSATMAVGDTLQLTANMPVDEWKSSVKTIATVQDGLVTALKYGTIKITATAGEQQAECRITIKSTVTEIELTESKILAAGSDFTIAPKLTVKDASTGEEMSSEESGFSFESADTAVATVTDGKIRALKAGETDITVSHTKCEEDAVMHVTVVAPLEGDFSLSARNGVNIYGRVENGTVSGKTCPKFVNTASGFEVCFSGTSLTGNFYSTCTLAPRTSALRVYVDGVDKIVKLSEGTTTATLAEGLEEGLHIVQVYKMIEECFSTVWLSGLELGGAGDEFYTPPAAPSLKMEVYGDSITAGYGALGGTSLSADNCDGTSTYAFLAARTLGAQLDVLCMQGRSLAVEGWANDYYLKDAYNKYSVASNTTWDFSASQPADYIVINLGENDMYGIETGKGTKQDFINGYKQMINGLRSVHPDAVIICVYGMMSRSVKLGSDIDKMVAEIGGADADIYSLKMIANSMGVGSHPDVSGHEQNAKVLVNFIRGLE